MEPESRLDPSGCPFGSCRLGFSQLNTFYRLLVSPVQKVGPSFVPDNFNDVGHQNVIISLAFSPDGRQILSGSWDGTAKIWDAAKGTLLRTFSWGARQVNAVAWSPDGKMVAVAADPVDEVLNEEQLARRQDRDWSFLEDDRDGPSCETRLFDPDTGDLLRVLDESGEGIAFSKDGKTLAIALWESLAVFDLTDGRCLAEHKCGSLCLRRVCYSQDGTSLACFSDEDVRLFDAGKVGLHDVVTDAWLFENIHSSDLEHGAVASYVADFWQRKLAGFRPSVATELAEMPGISFSPDGGRLACVQSSTIDEAGNWMPSRVTIMNSENLETERIVTSPSLEGVRAIAFSPSGQLLAGAGDWQTILVWDAVSGRQVCQIGEPPPGIRCVSFSPSGALLAAGAGDGTVFLCDPKEPSLVALDDSQETALAHIEFLPSGELLLLASEEGTVRLVDVLGLQTRLEFRCHEGPLVGGAITADGKRFLSAGYAEPPAQASGLKWGKRPEVCEWSLSDGRRLGRHPLPEEHSISSLAVSPDRRRLAVCSWRHVHVAELGDGIQEWRKYPASGAVRVAFLADASHLLVANEGYGMKPADIDHKTGGDWIIATRDYPTAFAVDSKRDLLVRATAFFNEIEVFELATGRLTKYLLGHRNSTDCLAISPDGEMVVSGSRDGMIKFWDLEMGEAKASVVLAARSDCGVERWRLEGRNHG